MSFSKRRPAPGKVLRAAMMDTSFVLEISLRAWKARLASFLRSSPTRVMLGISGVFSMTVSLWARNCAKAWW